MTDEQPNASLSQVEPATSLNKSMVDWFLHRAECFRGLQP